MTLFVGDDIKARAVFTDEDGDAVTPGAVTIRWQAPDNNIESRTYGSGGTPAITQNAPNDFQILVPATLAGLWTFYGFSTGNGKAAEQQLVYVNPVVPAS